MSKVHWSDRHPELIKELSARGIHPEPVLKYSLLSSARLRAVIRACDNIANLPGITAEVGCASGGTSRLIASITGRQHWACDTFEGLVDADKNDKGLVNGDFKNEESVFDGVSSRLAGLNAKVVKGRFPDCAPQEMADAQYALVHLDTDTYKSMADGFEFFQWRVVPGGYVILDDVIGKGTMGGKKFWAELDKTGWEVIEENDPHVVIRKCRG